MSPILLLCQVLVVLNRHILLHIELWKYLGDDYLVALGAIEVDVCRVSFPVLILLHLLIEVVDGMMNVNVQIRGDLGENFFRLTL